MSEPSAEPSPPSRSSGGPSITYSALALAFFFAIGLAGGAAYKLFWHADARPPVAQNPVAPAASDAAHYAPFLGAAIAPSAEPASPPPDSPAAAPLAQAATAPAPTPQDSAPQVAPATSAPQEAARLAPPADASPAEPAAAPVAPVPAKKPRATAAKPAHAAPEAAALRTPPKAPGGAEGPFLIQFGAFAIEENARRVQWAVEATGLKIEVVHGVGPSGHALFFPRSPAYADYASALSAAQAVQSRVAHFVNPVAIDYVIVSDHAASDQQAAAR